MSPNRTLDQFFKRINEIKPIPWKNHPPDHTLRDFATHQLRTVWTPSTAHLEKMLNETLKDWTATEVRAHVLTCMRCSERLHQLRRPRGNFIVWLDTLALQLPVWVFKPAVFRAHALAYIVATVGLFLLPATAINGQMRPYSPLFLLGQLIQGTPQLSWLGIVLLFFWLAWSGVVFLHFLLWRHKGLW